MSSSTNGSATMVECDDYFGVCPTCGKNDGYLNVGKTHWFVCHEHKVRWNVGSNLFSSWRHEDEETWHRNAEDIRGYTEITEVRPPARNEMVNGDRERNRPQTFLDHADEWSKQHADYAEDQWVTYAVVDDKGDRYFVFEDAELQELFAVLSDFMHLGRVVQVAKDRNDTPLLKRVTRLQRRMKRAFIRINNDVSQHFKAEYPSEETRDGDQHGG